MKFFRNAPLITLIITTVSFVLSGCFGRGPDDPWLSLHTRDARIAQNWELAEMTATIVNTVGGATTNISYNFDGSNIYITTNGVTVSYGYAFEMNVLDNGKVESKETFYDPANASSVVATSTKESFWYWADDVKNKTTVNLDLTGLYAPYPAYDITRLAYDDMSLLVDFTDNAQVIDPSTGNTTSSSTSVTLFMEFVYNDGDPKN